MAWLLAFRKEAKIEIRGFSKRLDVLAEGVGDLAKAIDAIDRYSYMYQYNVKIIGIPEVQPHESATATSTLCQVVWSYKCMGVEISLQDMDITHHTPTRSATSAPMPIICKFSKFKKTWKRTNHESL